LQVIGRDAEVGVTKLALNHDERHTFAGHLDSVRVAQLVRHGSAYALRRVRLLAAAVCERLTVPSDGRRSHHV
jgi:hypothetical protein